MNDTQKQDFMEQVAFPIFGVMLAVIVLAFGVELATTLNGAF